MERKDGFFTLKKVESHDSTSSSSSSSRRKSSFGSNWFKKLHNKIAGGEEETYASAPRKNSVSSVASTISEDGAEEQPTVSRSLSFKDSFRRNRGHSVTSQTQRQASGPTSPRAVSRSESPNTGGTPGHEPSSSPVSTGVTSSNGGVGGSRDLEHTTLDELVERKISTKAVGFSLSTFYDNPPQRIPPAVPENGNIEFSDNGDVLIYKRGKVRSPRDPPPRVVRSHSDVVKTASIKAVQNAERLRYSLNSNGFSFFGKGSSNAGNGGNSSGNGSSGCATNTATSGATSGGEEEDPLPMNNFMAAHDVDGTAKVPKNAQRNDTFESAMSDEEWEVTNAEVTPPPDQVYIRCCHLREIMPIRNILKQLQGQVAPIPRLRIANTKPTLVEIQAFSDFLSVVPVAALNIDNHILTDEMVRLLLVGISRSKDICRLCFVNTKFGVLGWQYLCSYLATRMRGLLALSLCCTNPTGVPNRIPAFDRSDMDWDLLTEALSRTGTLEELDLGGTMIPADKLRNLLDHGFKPRGQILSLANNKLSHSEVKFVADWAQLPDTHLMGINLSGNDLSRAEDRYLLKQLMTNTRLMQLSMRNANFTSIDASHIVNAITPEQASKSSLRQLDLSYNPGLFPDVLERLFNILPKFPNLSRLQLEHCGLDSSMIITLCESLSHCHRLVYVNFLGNSRLNQTAATALCVAVHLSRSICTVEADLEGSDLALRQQLARYCFQNLETNTGALNSEQSEPDENADIITFYDDLVAMRKYLNSDNELDTTNAIQSLVARIDELRDQIRHRLKSILARRKVAPPTTQDRVSAIRLIFYASSLDKLKQEVTGTGSQPAPSTAEEVVENVDEDNLRPPLVRQASQASLISLKKLEREEGESHKAYADQSMALDDDQVLDAIGNLKVHDLEKLMN